MDNSLVLLYFTFILVLYESLKIYSKFQNFADKNIGSTIRINSTKQFRNMYFSNLQVELSKEEKNQLTAYGTTTGTTR